MSNVFGKVTDPAWTGGNANGNLIQILKAIAASSVGGGTSAVTGNVASGATDSGNPVKVGGVYLSALPTYTNGQRGDLLLSARGALAICGFGAAGADGVSNATLGFMYTQNNTSGYLSATANYVFNGTSWDRDRKASAVARVASSAASGNPAFAKASAGDLKNISGQNGAAITYVHFYNKATAPTLGTDTPVISFAIPANANFNIRLPDRGLYFGTGIAYAFTTDIATIPTTGAAAAAITAFAAVYA